MTGAAEGVDKRPVVGVVDRHDVGLVVDRAGKPPNLVRAQNFVDLVRTKRSDHAWVTCSLAVLLVAIPPAYRCAGCKGMNSCRRALQWCNEIGRRPKVGNRRLLG